MKLFTEFMFGRPMEYVDSFYLPSPDADLDARNRERVQKVKEQMGDRWCLHPRKIEKVMR